MISQVLNALGGIVKGMGLTLKTFFEPKYTLQYPEERWHITPTFRGMPALLSNQETGKLKCTACGLCARNCPVGAIELTSEKGEDGKKQLSGYWVDMGRCIVCGLCAENCPFEALTMANEYELAGYSREQLVFSLEQLVAIGKEYSYNNQQSFPKEVFSTYLAEGGFCNRKANEVKPG